MTEKKDGGWKSGLLALVVVAAAAGGGWALLKSGPKTQPGEEKRAPKMVKVERVASATHGISVAAHGAVVAARELVVEPEVSGPVVKLHPMLIPGGLVKKGEELLEIDPTLARLAVEEAKAAVARSEAELEEARRKRDEARKLADETLLSRTELAALEADLRTEEADLRRLNAVLDRAEELLRRHKIVAPFNALILSESLEVGQRVDPGFAAATLVGTDEFWVRAAMPVDRLRHVRLPEGGRPGADVKVILETGDGKRATRSGSVIRLLGDMERTGRMARALIRIDDPLGLKAGADSVPFLLGSYVRVEIDAGRLENVLAIDRIALRAGNRVWIADANSELQIRDVEIVWREDETIFVKNVMQPGDALIVSPLKVALPRMKVEIRESAAPANGASAAGQAGPAQSGG